MSSLVEQVRRALAPFYTVERELGSGGMGVVFLAHDPRLERLVAIKVLRPERATAVAVERFSREAKLLARLNHPNVVRVYAADETDGFSYYVMEYLEGETLKDRLEAGPLLARAVRKLGQSLLEALGATHAGGIVHRDVKPANIFLLPNRTLLADFGIAHAGDDDTTLTDTGQRIGTLKYMAPEQLAGEPATSQSDIYSAGAVLYEACTGRRWLQHTPPDRGDWSGVPRALAEPLRSALALAARDRWASAAEFQAALADPPVRAVTVAGAAVGVLLLGLLAFGARDWLRDNPASEVTTRATLGVVPFADGRDGTVGRQLARHVATQLEWFRRWDFVWQDSAAGVGEAPGAGPAARLRAEGDLLVRGGDTVLQLLVRQGERLEHVVEVPGSAADLLGWGRDIADSIVRRTFPQYADEFRHYARRTSRHVPAHVALHAGQDAFRRDAWGDAERSFRSALDLDSMFAQAAWSLALVRKWARDSTHVLILRKLYATQPEDLPPLQRLLTEAELEPDLDRRLALFAEAVRRFPASADGLLLYGNELYHRGPLTGLPLDSGIAVLEEAARKGSFSTALVHAALGHIRLGHREQAERDLELLLPTGPGADPEATMRGTLLRFAYKERFQPPLGLVDRTVLRLKADSALLDELYRFARLANFFDLPETQIALGSILEAKGADVAVRASGMEAQGLALMLLGRPAAALSRLDAAATTMRSQEAGFQAQEWRLLPPVLGLPPVDDEEAAHARVRLAAEGEPFAARAAWVLAADAYQRRDTAAARTWSETLAGRAEARPRAAPLRRFAEALAAASRGAADSALAISEPLLRYDPAGLGGDPFARAAVYLHRAEWQRQTGDPAAADRTLRFVEAWDTHEWPQREAQSGEVDVVAGVVARLRRAQLAAAAGRQPVACALVARVRELWAGADAGYAALRSETDALAERCP